VFLDSVINIQTPSVLSLLLIAVCLFIPIIVLNYDYISKYITFCVGLFLSFKVFLVILSLTYIYVLNYALNYVKY
jgi:hypothetical protein